MFKLSRSILIPCLVLILSIPCHLLAASVSINNGLVQLPEGGGIRFPTGDILSDPTGIKGDKGDPGPPGPPGTAIAGGQEIGPVSMAANSAADLGSPLTVSNLVGGKNILVLVTIFPLTWGAAPAEYGGKNHSLHINVKWEILANDYVIGTYYQTAEQNIIQLQAGGSPTTTGEGSIKLRATNTSFWSLDDAPGGMTLVGSNNFYAVVSAMEI